MIKLYVCSYTFHLNLELCLDCYRSTIQPAMVKKEIYQFYLTMYSVSAVKAGWSGSDVVLYWSFDSPDGLALMENSELVGSVPLVSGKVTSVFIHIILMICCQPHTILRYISICNEGIVTDLFQGFPPA